MYITYYLVFCTVNRIPMCLVKECQYVSQPPYFKPLKIVFIKTVNKEIL